MDITAHYDAEILAYALGIISYHKLTDDDLAAVRAKLEEAVVAARRELHRRQRQQNYKVEDNGTA